ncbi:MAG: septal ring lytic transglycosylase RlpA family lipoprotein [Spirochaetae bacterium HGW-Spirochaetae-3]|nr:MAG: septal ring lytic transglycosylase RlpA family lipoprotein [Spirochaetae bacterium HGW-Spirochaetae-3]
MRPKNGTGPAAWLAAFWLAAALVPAVAQAAFVETGVASWYGEPFHGRRTANGEVFDMRAMSAAHKSLPFGTLVRVTNLADGQSVVVRINDRGPFVAGRIIDLSKAAAVTIGLDRSGTARVEIRSVPAGTALGPTATGPTVSGTTASPGLKTAFPDSPRTMVRIQVGSYRDAGNAGAAVEGLAALGLAAIIEKAGSYHRVAIYAASEDRSRIEAVLDRAGWKDRLVKEIRK